MHRRHVTAHPLCCTADAEIQHASSVENAEESKGQLQSDLDEARKKAENAVKDLEQLKNDYKKLNTVIKALIAAGDTNNDELKKQQEAVDKQAKAVDDKLKTVATPVRSYLAPERLCLTSR